MTLKSYYPECFPKKRCLLRIYSDFLFVFSFWENWGHHNLNCFRDFLTILLMTPSSFKSHRCTWVMSLMIYPLDRRNTKKLKNQKPKTKMQSFLKNNKLFSQIFSKKAKITMLFWLKNPKNDNIILVISI